MRLHQHAHPRMDIRIKQANKTTTLHCNAHVTQLHAKKIHKLSITQLLFSSTTHEQICTMNDCNVIMHASIHPRNAGVSNNILPATVY